MPAALTTNNSNFHEWVDDGTLGLMDLFDHGRHGIDGTWLMKRKLGLMDLF